MASVCAHLCTLSFVFVCTDPCYPVVLVWPSCLFTPICACSFVFVCSHTHPPLDGVHGGTCHHCWLPTFICTYPPSACCRRSFLPTHLHTHSHWSLVLMFVGPASSCCHTSKVFYQYGQDFSLYLTVFLLFLDSVFNFFQNYLFKGEMRRRKRRWRRWIEGRNEIWHNGKTNL